MLDLDSRTGLPNVAALTGLLDGNNDVSVARLVDQALLDPAKSLTTRPSKKFRSMLVSLGARLLANGASRADDDKIKLCSQAVELLHAGSLIVDDIQDGSVNRRGGAAVHKLFGTPSALCTGNWLYFWPLRLIKELQLPVALEHQAFAYYHEALEQAHYGQALDLSIKASQLPQSDIATLTNAILDLKTGAITALAMKLGATIYGGSPEDIAHISQFGRRFGVALQELDDIGNVFGRVDPEKRYEDLMQLKLTAIWKYAAEFCDAPTYARFGEAVDKVKAGDPLFLSLWLVETELLHRALGAIREQLDAAHNDLVNSLQLATDHPVLKEIKSIEEALFHAYI